MREQLLPVSNIPAYCLMPNHFHISIQATENSAIERKSFGGKPMQEFACRVGLMLSSYTQAINKQNNTSGSLFQQKTKSKILTEKFNNTSVSYLEDCFDYIHQNPLVAGLVKDLAAWSYSSYPDYYGLRNGTLCKKEIFFTFAGIHQNALLLDKLVGENLIVKLY